MKVTNINGTSDNSCRCDSWLDHWEKFGGGLLFNQCAVEGCFYNAQVGAHVKKHNSSDNNWYIIPLCNRHNLTNRTLEIEDSTRLVSANVRETCGR